MCEMEKAMDTHKKNAGYVITVLIIGICLNLSGKWAAAALDLPLWFDAIGTCFSACLLGPVYGAACGVINNLIYGIFHPVSMVYSVTSVAVGAIVGIRMRRGKMSHLFDAMTTSIMVAFASTVVSTPLNLFFWEGFSGNTWSDTLYRGLCDRGIWQILAAVMGELFVDFPDKIIVVLIVYLILHAKEWRKKKVHAESLYAGLFVFCSIVFFEIAVQEVAIGNNGWFKAYLVFVCVVGVIYLTWLATVVHSHKIIEKQQREIAFAKRQAEMGNQTILAIAKTVDAKDGRTSQHAARVSEYSVLIAKALGWGEAECENLRQIALLHDIGKIGIPDAILNKPDRLTEEEYRIMKSHVEIGAEILKDFTLVEHVADGVKYHHERYDGSGYPKGLKGEEIPLNARIIGIADAFDAMSFNRVYREHLDQETVIKELEKGRGTQFDPRLTDVFLELIRNGSVSCDIQTVKQSAP